MNNLITIENVKGYLDKATGIAYLNAEDVARGFGFTQTQNKGGKEYTSVRWARVNEYLRSFGFPPQVGENDYIPENMVYRLGFKANNETAQRFQAILADEIIPSIRRHGAYMTEDAIHRAITEPDFLIKLATELKEEKEAREKAQRQIEIDRPKVIFANAVSASKTSILVGELAKILRGNNIQIGQKRLFQWLRDRGYLIRRHGSEYNMPTQYAMELGLFEIREGSYIDGGGVNHITKTAKITGKGQTYFINKFLNKRKAE